ncbi:hypothetical protein ACFX2I_020173 [Malus domestica]
MGGNRVGIICCRSTRVSGMEGLQERERERGLDTVAADGFHKWESGYGQRRPYGSSGFQGDRGRGHEQTLLRVGCARSCDACLKSKDKFVF